MSFPSPHRRGAPKGNFNALKHGFYTRRFNKRDLSGVEHTDTRGLAEEIALIRVYTRRLIETAPRDADLYETAGILRALCMASSTITRIIKAQAFLTNDPNSFYREIDEAIRQVGIEMGILPDPNQPDSPDEPSDPSLED